jgi:hypothetical protein
MFESQFYKKETEHKKATVNSAPWTVQKEGHTMVRFIDKELQPRISSLLNSVPISNFDAPDHTHSAN